MQNVTAVLLNVLVLGVVVVMGQGCGMRGEHDETASGLRAGDQISANDSLFLSTEKFSDNFLCGTEKGVRDPYATNAWNAILRAGDDVDRVINNISQVNIKMSRGALFASEENAKFLCNVRGYAIGKVSKFGSFRTAQGNSVYKWSAKERLLKRESAAGQNKTITGVICSKQLEPVCTTNRDWLFSENPLDKKWTQIKMADARVSPIAVAVASDIFMPGVEGADLDKYDTKSKLWSKIKLPGKRRGIFSLQVFESKIFVVSGPAFEPGYISWSEPLGFVDIYDTLLGSFETKVLSARATDQMSVVRVQGKIILAGLTDRRMTPTSNVDIYDIATGSWSTTQLPNSRVKMAHAVVGGKVVFVGGRGEVGYSKAVDLYDPATNNWRSFRSLQEGTDDVFPVVFSDVAWFLQNLTSRGYTSAYLFDGKDFSGFFSSHLYGKEINDEGVVNGKKAIFPTNNCSVIIFDSSSQHWDESELSFCRGSKKFIAAGSKALVAGGIININSSRIFTAVDIYDVDTEKWSFTNMPIGAIHFSSLVLDKKLYLIGGNTVDSRFPWLVPQNVIQVFDLN